MNGVHDLGGMDGLGPIVREKDEPVFHHSWERRVFGIALATMGQGIANLDEVRHAIERMDPAHYLSSTYYEHWLDGFQRLLVEKGVLSAEDIEARTRAIAAAAEPPPVPERSDPKLAEGLRMAIRHGGSYQRSGPQARFGVGDEVHVRRASPVGHTRCPRYVRGAAGTIERVHGVFVLPDAHAHGRGESPEPLYCVRFRAADLWSEGDDLVYVDLWESYLEPAAAAKRGRRTTTKRRDA